MDVFTCFIQNQTLFWHISLSKLDKLDHQVLDPLPLESSDQYGNLWNVVSKRPQICYIVISHFSSKPTHLSFFASKSRYHVFWKANLVKRLISRHVQSSEKLRLQWLLPVFLHTCALHLLIDLARKSNLSSSLRCDVMRLCLLPRLKMVWYSLDVVLTWRRTLPKSASFLSSR